MKRGGKKEGKDGEMHDLHIVSPYPCLGDLIKGPRGKGKRKERGDGGKLNRFFH